MLAQEDWEIVRLPAIAEDDETIVVDSLLGPRCFERRRGEALHPVREPLAMLEQIRRTIGEYNFAGQYQQMPSPLGGGLVKAAWFRHYAAEEMLAQFERIVQSWDTASKATELSDFSVCTSWGIHGKNLYLLDVLRRRMEYPELKRAVREQYERFRPSVVLIEDKASGTQLIQELIAEGLLRRHPLPAAIGQGHAHARADRDDRERFRPPARYRTVARTLSARIDDLPQRPARRPGRLDRADARLVQARQRPQLQRGDLRTLPNAGRRSAPAAGRAGAPGASARPVGIGRMNLLHLNAAADGTVEMLESEAESFLRAGWVRVG